jgi:hypothetical protein
VAAESIHMQMLERHPRRDAGIYHGMPASSSRYPPSLSSSSSPDDGAFGCELRLNSTRRSSAFMSASFWLKLIGSTKNRWRTRYDRDYVDFATRPSVRRGDQMVLYAVGGLKRVFALVEVAVFTDLSTTLEG